MSDRYSAYIEIGGHLHKKQVPRLLQAIAEAGVCTEWDGASFEPADANELLTACKRGRIWLCDHQARDGEFPELEETCRLIELSYRRHSDSWFGIDPEIVDWRPGMNNSLTRMASNCDQDTFVPEKEVRKALTHLEKEQVGKAKALLRRLCPNIPEVPPFEII